MVEPPPELELMFITLLYAPAVLVRVNVPLPEPVIDMLPEVSMPIRSTDAVINARLWPVEVPTRALPVELDCSRSVRVPLVKSISPPLVALLTVKDVYPPKLDGEPVPIPTFVPSS